MFAQALQVVDPIVMLFLLAFVGLVARRVGLMSDSTIKGITMVLMMVAQPALMIEATQKVHTPDMVGHFFVVTGMSTVFLMATQLLSYLGARRLDDNTRAVFASLSSMPNAGFIGMPIVSALYGDAGMLYLAGFILGFNIAQWTVGLSMYTGFGVKALRNLINPVFICVVIGAALFYFDIQLTGPVRGTISHLSALNTPLAMLLLGARLEALRPRHLADGRLMAAVALKLLVFPLLMLVVLRPFGLDPLLYAVLVLTAAMPSGSNAQMFAERYDRDTQFAAKGISVTTLLCIVTLPIVLMAMSL